MTNPVAPPIALADGVSRDYLIHHRLCPKALSDDGHLVVDVAPNAFRDALDDLSFAYRRTVVVEEVTTDEVERLIERLTTRSERSIELARIDSEGEDDTGTADVRDLANQPPVVR